MIDALKNIISECPQGFALLGLDVGKKTIGLAVSDSAHRIAMPIKTIKRTKFGKDLLQVEQVVRDYEVGGFVIGYPLNMDGTEGGKCQSVRDFALELERQISPDLKHATDWIALQDERLSTHSVEFFVDKDVDISKRRAKDTGLIDKLAAQLILQGALDTLQN